MATPQVVWDRRFLRLAQEVATWSRDPSTKVGAVIVRNRKIIVSTGYNGFPRGLDDDEGLYADREQKYKRTLHAEVNAILHAERSVRGMTLYSTLFPCSNCALLIVQSSIGRVVTYDTDIDRWRESFELSRSIMEQTGIQVEVLPHERTSDASAGHPGSQEPGRCQCRE